MTSEVVAGAPARQLARAGALVLMALLAACERTGSSSEGPRVLELANDTIRLESGVRLVDVKVQRTEAGEFEPAAVEARQGDVVRFTAEDNGGHALSFDAASLSPEAAEYLGRTGQMRAPPLIASGAAWVITLDGAPVGTYGFRCATHNVAGQLTIAPR